MNYKFYLVAALSVSLFTGCGAARPSMYYQLSVPANMTSVTAPGLHDVTLLLGPLRASHLYREDHIVYGSSDEHMGTYENQRWTEPPTEMFEDALLRELRASGHYRAVDSLRSNAHGDYILSGHLYDFKEISVAPLSTRVTFDLELRETKTGLTVWTHSYSHDEPAAGKDISAVVAALDRNAQSGIRDIMSSLDQFFSTRSGN